MPVAFRPGLPADALCVGVLAMQVFLDTYATAGIRPDLAFEVTSVCSPEAFSRRLEDPARRFVLAENARASLSGDDPGSGPEPLPF